MQELEDWTPPSPPTRYMLSLHVRCIGPLRADVGFEDGGGAPADIGDQLAYVTENHTHFNSKHEGSGERTQRPFLIGDKMAQQDQNQRLEQLKQKYQSVLRAMEQQQIRLQNLHVQDNKLFIRARRLRKQSRTRSGIKSKWLIPATRTSPRTLRFHSRLRTRLGHREAGDTRSDRAGRRTPSKQAIRFRRSASSSTATRPVRAHFQRQPGQTR